LNDENLRETQNARSDDEKPAMPKGTAEISAISKTGYKLLKKDRVDEAMECFDCILKQDENNNYALVGMGDAYRKKGAFDRALEHYKRCLACYPENSYALFGIADCYRTLNRHDKAIEVWEKYLLHDGENITVLTRVANAYRKVHDFKNAKKIFLKVLELEKDNHYAIIGLGHLYYDFKEYKDALSCWERMLDLTHEDVDIRVLTSIGNCHRKMKNFALGAPYFERVIEREADNFYAAFGLADCYRGMCKQNLALVYWNQILAQDPRNRVILTRAGDAYRTLGDLERAQDYYERAMNVEYDIYAVLGLAMIAKIQKRYSDAAISLQRLSQQDSRNHRICIEFADCMLKMGERRRAIEILEDFQKKGVRNAQVAEMFDKI